MRVSLNGKQGKAAVVYEQGPVDFCCVGMARWWGMLFGFGVHGHASTNKTVNAYLSRSQTNSKPAVEVVPIDYCPFCGEAVEVSRAKISTIAVRE